VTTPWSLAVLVLAACALALPFFLRGFRTYQLAFAASNAIAILGLNLIGALLVLSMRFMPNGVAGAVSVWRWLATWATRARL
jgi:hypothetical protein